MPCRGPQRLLIPGASGPPNTEGGIGYAAPAVLGLPKWGRGIATKSPAVPGSPRQPPPPRAQEPAMFDRGTRGRFLRMTVGSPVPRKKKNFRRVAPAYVHPLLSHNELH